MSRSHVGALRRTTMAALLLAAPLAQADDGEARFRDLYRELVETNTTLSVGSCLAAEQAMAARLKAAGYADADMQILAPPERPKDAALIVTLPGKDAKALPILLLAHVDVVEARREDWQRDPFKLVEENGFFYGRGASDDKAMAAIFTDSLIRYREAGYKPRRGIRLALTCGEETSATFDGVEWLLRTHPDLMKAAFALNEGAGGELDDLGRPVALQIQAGEKVYQDYTLETTNAGGHSSRPLRDNAIYRMATALQKIADYQFPTQLNQATRGYFEAQTRFAPPEVAADLRAILDGTAQADAAAQRLWTFNPGWNSMLRTTCVATQINGGHAPNALPQRTTVNVNCRIFPGVTPEAVLDTLKQVVGDPQVDVKLGREHGLASNPPSLTPAIVEPIKAVAAGIWGEVPLVPTMSTGATDSRYLNAAGIPAYGVSGLFSVPGETYAHGLNEKIRVKSLLDGRRFLHELVRRYAEQKG